MEAGLREVLDLVFRWLHVVAGIMWIGNSMLFNWLDRNLVRRQGEEVPGEGRIWLLHSGGFYEVRKTMLADQPLPVPLHWFKWQAYTTWLSGAVLLVVVYYAGGGALLVDPAVAEIPLSAAVAVAVSTLVGGWLVYHLLLARLLARAGWLAAPLGVALVGSVGWALLQLISGRAAFLHVGAMLGTLMAGNVLRVIIPSQRALVAAVARGERPDPALASYAKERSIHNNYMTFPVVVLMLGGHFPSLYGHRLGWLSLLVLVLSGAIVRHLLNVRFTFARWRPALAGAIACAVAALYLLSARPAPPAISAATAGGEVTFADARGVVEKRCAVCHSASPADRTFGVAPGGVSFDEPEQIRALASRIRARAVESRTMPPANRTWITDHEREVLRRWVDAGAPLR